MVENLWVAVPPTLWLPSQMASTPDEDDDGELNKEVYARYGLAMYSAQVLEHEIVNILVITRITEAKGAAEQILSDPWEQRFRDTMAELARRLKANPVSTPELIDRLDHAVKLRNFLAHGYFRERAEEWFSEAGRLSMIAELDQAHMTFKALNDDLEACTAAMKEDFGATPDVIQAMFETMLVQAKARDQAR